MRSSPPLRSTTKLPVSEKPPVPVTVRTTPFPAKSSEPAATTLVPRVTSAPVVFACATKFAPLNWTGPIFGSVAPPATRKAKVPLGRIRIEAGPPESWMPESSPAPEPFRLPRKRSTALPPTVTWFVFRSFSSTRLPEISPSGVPTVSVPSACRIRPSAIVTAPTVRLVRPVVFTLTFTVPPSVRPAISVGNEPEAEPVIAKVPSPKIRAAAVAEPAIASSIDCSAPVPLVKVIVPFRPRKPGSLIGAGPASLKSCCATEVVEVDVLPSGTFTELVVLLN